MAYKSKILLGRILKVSGYEGAVSVKLEKNFSENIPEMESLFLEIEGRLVPFFISYSEYSGAEILKLKFEGYESVEKIKEFAGCRVLLTTNVPLESTDEDIQHFIGYDVYIQGDKLLGKVSALIPNTGQWLINILSPEKKEILIPFHDHFIVSIDNKRKIILLDIPEGLTEIN